MSDEKGIELEAVAGYLGINAEDLDGFKESFESQFIRRANVESFESQFIRRANVKDDPELAGSITGKRLGSLETTVKQIFKKSGFDLADIDTKGKKLEEVIEAGLGHVTNAFGDKIKGLEDAVTHTDDEAFKKLENKFSKQSSRLLEVEGLLTDTRGKYEGALKDKETAVKSIQINTLKRDALSKIPFKSDLTDLERTGFNTVVNSKYKLDVDDTGSLMVMDATGSRIPNPQVTGTFMGLEDVLKAEAIANKLYKLNDNGGAAAPKFASFGQVQQTEQPTNPTRKVSRRHRK
jgi:hypothetical protein